MTHVDPLVLKTDLCLACLQPCTTQRVPCINCFGASQYCSEKCLWAHYPDHNQSCSKQLGMIRRSNFFQHRQRQYGPRYGYSALLQHLLTTLEQDVLKASLYFIRLPFDTNQKIKTDYPVKQIARAGALGHLKNNQALSAAWAAFVQHERTTPHWAHFFAYPPDTSFVFWTAVPLTELTDPVMRVIPCPCQVHTK
jgi:hypothetical protein